MCGAKRGVPGLHYSLQAPPMSHTNVTTMPVVRFKIGAGALLGCLLGGVVVYHVGQYYMDTPADRPHPMLATAGFSACIAGVGLAIASQIIRE